MSKTSSSPWNRPSLLSFLLVLLLSIVSYYLVILRGGSKATRLPDKLWTTVVGMEDEDINDISLFVEPLQHGRLLGMRAISPLNPFVSSLEIQLPPAIRNVLVAVYSNDPHLNWRKAHLLYQYAKRKFLSLIFRGFVATGDGTNSNGVLTIMPGLKLPISHIQYTIDNIFKEETLLILKPDIARKTDEIMPKIQELLQSVHLSILQQIQYRFNEEIADLFYAQHAQSLFFSQLQEYICEDDSLVLIVQGMNAVDRLRELVGGTDPTKAAPNTLRSLFGHDITRNGFHSSDSSQSFSKELLILLH